MLLETPGKNKEREDAFLCLHAGGDEYLLLLSNTRVSGSIQTHSAHDYTTDVCTSPFHSHGKVRQSCGDVWYSLVRRGHCSSLGAELCEVEAERAWERIDTIFSTGTFFSSPGITGNLQGEISVGDMIHKVIYRRDMQIVDCPIAMSLTPICIWILSYSCANISDLLFFPFGKGGNTDSDFSCVFCPLPFFLVTIWLPLLGFCSFHSTIDYILHFVEVWCKGAALQAIMGSRYLFLSAWTTVA